MTNKSPSEKHVIDYIQTGAIVVSSLLVLAQVFLLNKQIGESTKAQIVNNLITLNQQVYPSANINQIFQSIDEKKKLFNKNGGMYSDTEMDNFLGYFEMIGIINSRGYLDIDIIDDMFGDDVLSLEKNKEIMGYINEDIDSWPNLKKLLIAIKEDRKQ